MPGQSRTPSVQSRTSFISSSRRLWELPLCFMTRTLPFFASVASPLGGIETAVCTHTHINAVAGGSLGRSKSWGCVALFREDKTWSINGSGILSSSCVCVCVLCVSVHIPGQSRLFWGHAATTDTNHTHQHKAARTHTRTRSQLSWMQALKSALTYPIGGEILLMARNLTCVKQINHNTMQNYN